MNVTITREVPFRALTTLELQRLARLAAAHRRSSRVDTMAVTFVSPTKSRRWNDRYRRQRQPTDVLSFLVDGHADIVVCPDVLRRKAREDGRPLRHEAAHSITHGMLHAMGWDHQTPRTLAAMHRTEELILSTCHFPFAH